MVPHPPVEWSIKKNTVFHKIRFPSTRQRTFTCKTTASQFFTCGSARMVYTADDRRIPVTFSYPHQPAPAISSDQSGALVVRCAKPPAFSARGPPPLRTLPQPTNSVLGPTAPIAFRRHRLTCKHQIIEFPAGLLKP